ncbi:MAG: group II intron reverse transcriptase/maturase [Parvibaculaceae bacterium]
MAGSLRPGSISTRRARIADIAKNHRGEALYTLSHHMDIVWLHEAYNRTRKGGATGVDGVSAEDYSEALLENLEALLDKAKSGLYRAPPVRRAFIPKDDGSSRPLGIPTFEDKVLQRAVMMLINPIYEQDFYDFSYGFRPGRSPHDAVSALRNTIHRMKGGWVLEVDVQNFFEELDHQALREILRERVRDKTVVRLIGKWLRAGVLEGGVIHRAESGSPQGGVISPLLANIFLHTVLDKWWVEDVQPRLYGFENALIRYADDFVMVFDNRRDAERVQESLRKRFARYGLRMHPEKTRLVEFKRPGRGQRKGASGSFSFLGFTHVWKRSRKGNWTVHQRTQRERFARTMKRLNQWMKRSRHRPVKEQAEELKKKLQGHYRYYGVTGNWDALHRLKRLCERQWMKWLNRRSQRKSFRTWKSFKRKVLKRYPLPRARIARSRAQHRLAIT